MTIHPLPGGAGRPDSTRAPGVGSPPPAEAERRLAEPERAPGGDAVELSAAARDLLAREGADVPPIRQLPAERLQQIARRLAEGHYDRPEVLDRAAERLLEALDRGDA
ncbi:MAG TPA: flagellar biosynthesis anti-sigma factor FlgM [Gemmatimonadales bacterium]|jgi:hypothetical protein|nr:flagellar biosynthesis anti-sigma factor FlgM [Gemmatimonadales bacterium]